MVHRRSGESSTLDWGGWEISIIFLMLLTCQGALGSSVLLRGGRKSVPEPTSVTTFGGRVQASTSQLKPATPLTVALLLETLDSAARADARAKLLFLYSQMHGRPLRLAVLRSGEVEISGPFLNRIQLERTLSIIDSPVNPAPGPALFDTLISKAKQLGSKWSPVLLVGELPRLGSEVEDYAQALLPQRFVTQQLRVFLLSPSPTNETWRTMFQSSGGEVLNNLGELNPLLDEVGQVFLQVNWNASQPPAGFLFLSASINDAVAKPLVIAHDLVTSGTALRTVAQYATMQQQLAQASILLSEPFGAENLQQVRDLVFAAQQINPIDPGVLRNVVLLDEKRYAFPEAVKAATLLTQVRPMDGLSFLALGESLALTSDFDQAEAALNKAASLNVSPQQLAEQYARVHLGRNNEQRALPYLDEALKTDGKRDDLWFLQAQAAEQLQEYALAIHSLENGLAVSGVRVTEVGALLRLYLLVKEPEKAHALAMQTIERLPTDVATRAQFAEVLDNLHLQGEALAAWKSVLAVQPNAEMGHESSARLLLEMGDAKASEEAAASGLQILPNSGALYLVKADATKKQGRAYDARSTLEQGAAVTGDVTVLSRLAIEQEAYGDQAANTYALLEKVLTRDSPERLNALRKGFTLALRDGDLKQAEAFSVLLNAEAHPEYRALLGAGRKFGDDAIVPGGLDAFSFVAHMKRVSPDKFFAEFANHVVANVCTKGCTSDHYSGVIQTYLATISELESLGKRDGDHVWIRLSLDGKTERNHTQDVLRLLGLQMHTEKGQLRLDRGEKQDQAKRQEILSALALDEVGLQEALQSGKSFEFVIHDETAEIYPNAKMWKDSFPRSEQGQFALMLLHSPQIARLYLGISVLDPRTLTALVGTGGLYWLTGRPAHLLSAYGASFAMEGTHAAVPGGASAEIIWSQMVGTSPEHPGAFFQALLQKKDSSLLAYFYALSHLDSKHQAFFTANLVRAQRFYTLFASLPESQPSFAYIARDSSFIDLLRSVPLDDKGQVAFPGSPEVWTIAKGNATDDKRLAKMMNKVSAATPEVEDQILLRLAETRYKSNVTRKSELENFLAVSRIDIHRTKRLDEETTLLLAQHYGEFSPVYPYFTDLKSISPEGFRSFFDLFDRIRQQPPLQQNLELGQLHSLIEWVVLLERRHAIDDAEAARLFALICVRLAAADNEGASAVASMELAAAILNSCRPGAVGKLDENLRICLLGEPTDINGSRAKDYELVLDELKSPRLDVLRSIYSAAADVLNPSTTVPHIQIIAKGNAMLPFVPIPKDARAAGKVKEAIRLYDPASLQKLVDEWNDNAAKSAKNLKTTRKLAEELLKAMGPQVTLALSGPIYAYFMRGSDLVVSEDPLLLRKHRYFDFDSLEQHRTIRESEFIASSEGLGSYLKGGFAQFGLAAGFAAAAGWKQSGSGGTAVMAEQIAAIRSATWDRLRESDQRLVALRILAAREWIVRSAQEPAVFLTLSEDTSGLLSLSRRAALLNGIQERDWQQVWTSITLPDLFALGGNYLKRYPNDPTASPVTAQLRVLAVDTDPSRLDVLGRVPNEVLGCSHTHIISDAPYEEYERQLKETSLAERTAEFKLFLAYRADSLGIEPAELSQVVEKLAAKAFQASQMTDYRDWRSLLTAFASISNVDLKEALPQ